MKDTEKLEGRMEVNLGRENKLLTVELAIELTFQD